MSHQPSLVGLEPTTIRVISLWQPYASLMAWGYKTAETRHWSTHHTGWLGIHAAKRPMGPDERWVRDRAVEYQGQVAHAVPDLATERPWNDLPYQALVAVVWVHACVESERAGYSPEDPFIHGWAWAEHDDDVPVDERQVIVGENEELFGDLGPGRYAWLTGNTHELVEPIPMVGHQGFWSIEAPIELPEVA